MHRGGAGGGWRLHEERGCGGRRGDQNVVTHRRREAAGDDASDDPRRLDLLLRGGDPERGLCAAGLHLDLVNPDLAGRCHDQLGHRATGTGSLCTHVAHRDQKPAAFTGEFLTDIQRGRFPHIPGFPVAVIDRDDPCGGTKCVGKLLPGCGRIDRGSSKLAPQRGRNPARSRHKIGIAVAVEIVTRGPQATLEPSHEVLDLGVGDGRRGTVRPDHRCQ